MKKLWLVVALVAAIGGEVGAAEVVISFEQGQGFPTTGGKFTDTGTPEGVLLELKPKQMLTLVKGGRATATIVTPANPGKWTNEAVKWLQEYVQKATGAKLSAITEDMATL